MTMMLGRGAGSAAAAGRAGRRQRRATSVASRERFMGFAFLRLDAFVCSHNRVKPANALDGESRFERRPGLRGSVPLWLLRTDVGATEAQSHGGPADVPTPLRKRHALQFTRPTTSAARWT